MGSSSKCLQCGYQWNHSGKIPPCCPNCKSKDWNTEPDGETCSVGGGTCDLCGCTFFTGALQAHFCPNCGSSNWDGGEKTVSSAPNLAAAQIKKYVCLDCGHVWASKKDGPPNRCPNRKGKRGKYCGSCNIEEIKE